MNTFYFNIFVCDKADFKLTGEVEAPIPLTFCFLFDAAESELPEDEGEICQLKNTMLMELMWVQQAINSRKHVRFYQASRSIVKLAVVL